MQLISLNAQSYPIVFRMVQSGDHRSELIGGSPAVTISQNGGSFVTPVGTVSEIGFGLYKLTAAGTDIGTKGPLRLRATASGGDNSYEDCQVVDPADTANVLLDLPDAVEAGLTPRQAFRLISAALAGVVAGADGPSIIISGAGVPATPRISATVDPSGNRTAVRLMA